MPTAGQNDIESFLESIGLTDYAQSFADNEITWDLLAELDDGDLRDIGVTAMGHRKILLRAIREIEPERSPSPGPIEPRTPLENLVLSEPAPPFRPGGTSDDSAVSNHGELANPTDAELHGATGVDDALTLTFDEKTTVVDSNEVERINAALREYVRGIAGKDADEIETHISRAKYERFDLLKSVARHTFEHRSLTEKTQSRRLETIPEKSVGHQSVDLWQHPVPFETLEVQDSFVYDKSQEFHECRECQTAGEVTCRNCNGTTHVTCPSCYGRGWRECSSCNGKGARDCTSCRGKGQTQCRGSGLLQTNHNTWISRDSNPHELCQNCGAPLGGPGAYMPCGEYDCRNGRVECRRCSGRGGEHCPPQIGCRECSETGIQICHQCDGNKHHLTWLQTDTCFEELSTVVISSHQGAPCDLAEVISFAEVERFDEASLDTFDSRRLSDVRFEDNVDHCRARLLAGKPHFKPSGIQAGSRIIRGTLELAVGSASVVTFDLRGGTHSVWFDTSGRAKPDALEIMVEFAEQRQIERGEIPDPILELRQRRLFDKDEVTHARRLRWSKMVMLIGSFIAVPGALYFVMNMDQFVSRAEVPIGQLKAVVALLAYFIVFQLFITAQKHTAPVLDRYLKKGLIHRDPARPERYAAVDFEEIRAQQAAYDEVEKRKRMKRLMTGASPPFSWELALPEVPAVLELETTERFEQRHVDNYLCSNHEFWKSFFHALMSQPPGMSFSIGSEKNLRELSKSFTKLGLREPVDSLNQFCILKGEYILCAAGFTILTNMRLLINYDGWLSLPFLDLKEYRMGASWVIKWQEGAEFQQLELVGTALKPSEVKKAMRQFDPYGFDENQKALLRMERHELISKSKGSLKIDRLSVSVKDV